MTTRQIILGLCVYSLALAAIVYFTRPTGRRLAGALAGGAIVAGLALWALIPFGEARGWWHVPLDPAPAYQALLFLATAVSTAPIFLVTWRVARRFGRSGLAVAAVLGP